jgi:hypothetical protein
MYTCGNGLWIDIRGQNTLEATSRIAKNWTPEVVTDSISGYTASYNYDEGTKAYYEFPAKDRSKHDNAGVVYHKLHVSEGAAAFFVVVFYHQGSDKTGADPQFFRREDLTNSSRCTRLDLEKQRARDKIGGMSKRFTENKANLKQKPKKNTQLAQRDNNSSLETQIGQAATGKHAGPQVLPRQTSNPSPKLETSCYRSFSSSSEEHKELNVQSIQGTKYFPQRLVLVFTCM